MTLLIIQIIRQGKVRRAESFRESFLERLREPFRVSARTTPLPGAYGKLDDMENQMIWFSV